MYSYFNSEITWLIYDILLLFCVGYRVTDSFNFFVRYFSPHNDLLVFVCLLCAAGSDGFPAAFR